MSLQFDENGGADDVGEIRDYWLQMHGRADEDIKTLELLQDLGVHYARFDQDGPVLEGLPQHNW